MTAPIAVDASARVVRAHREDRELPLRTSAMDDLIRVLAAKARASEYLPELYARAMRCINRLGLSASGAALAARRLGNAREYAVRDHGGPAEFELRMLRSQIA